MPVIPRPADQMPRQGKQRREVYYMLSLEEMMRWFILTEDDVARLMAGKTVAIQWYDNGNVLIVARLALDWKAYADSRKGGSQI